MKDLEEFYRNYYMLIKKAIKANKKIIESILPFNKNQKELIKKIKNTRQKLTKLFNHREIVDFCRKCHLSGKGCCEQTSENVSLKQQDVLYILADNLDFKLPEPDIKFLTSTLNSHPVCVFLSKNGCLLKENRPITCLDHYCDNGLSLVLNKLFLKEKVLKNSQIINRVSLEFVQSIIAQYEKTKDLQENEQKNTALKAASSPITDFYLTKFL